MDSSDVALWRIYLALNALRIYLALNALSRFLGVQEPDVSVLPATLDAVSSIIDMVEPGMIQHE